MEFDSQFIRIGNRHRAEGRDSYSSQVTQRSRLMGMITSSEVLGKASTPRLVCVHTRLVQ